MCIFFILLTNFHPIFIQIATAPTIPRHGRLPMWNEHVKPLRDDSLFWYWLWKADRPAAGVLAAVMRSTRAQSGQTV